MERELWPPLYHALRTVAKDFHQKYVSYHLGPLPAWMQGWERVRSWVWAKLLINAVRLLNNHGLTT